MRDLPRQLSVQELAELFEGRTRFVDRLARLEDPLGRARALVRSLPPDEQQELLDAHPPIGARSGLSARSRAEQGDDDDPQVLAQLDALNRAYEERFGFRFVVFVNRRPRREIVPILRERLGRTREQELATGVDELVQIALDRYNDRVDDADRWRRS
jgi:2-oxo-4-hydroxy-4-carboxy--5-ureidoimidazoline (OHCU) decarboxylase